MSRLHLIAVILTGAALLRYTAACWLHPFADCRLCHGLGHRARVNRRTGKASKGKPCRWCRTTGKRLRWGRRAFNHLNASRNSARQADAQNTTTTAQAYATAQARTATRSRAAASGRH